MWEDSDYIDYRNRWLDCRKAFRDHLVNWDYVAELYEAADNKRGASRLRGAA